MTARLASSLVATLLALQVDSAWLRSATYTVTHEYGPAVLLVTLPPGHPLPPGILLTDTLEAAACAAIRLPGSGLDVPLGVLLEEGGRVRGHALVRRCPE